MNPAKPLPNIPRSRQVIWREYRRRIVPKLVFAAVLCGLVRLWQAEINAPSLVGQVEPFLAVVNSPKTGILTDFNLERLQSVKAGEQVGQIVTTDPKVLASTLAVIQAEIGLLRLNLEPGRFAIQYDRLRLDWMNQRASLAGLKVKLQQAESDLRRAKTLAQGKIVADSALEKMQATRDKLQADIEQRTSLVADMAKSLEAHGPQSAENTAAGTPGSTQDILRASVAVQEEKLRLSEAELSPIILRAPIDGTLDLIHHRAGETVLAGEPIATINALTSGHIAGYVRQPGPARLKVGMAVEVRSRLGNTPYGKGSILTIGTRMEPINPLLLPVTSSPVPVLGLPVDISVPKELNLFPGEVVDLVLR